MKLSFSLVGVFAAVASAKKNPFAPAKTKNTGKSAYVSKLVKGARVLRSLEEEEYQVDISQYSIKFEKCQFIKAYDDELAQEEDISSVLATKRFVIFRLCPNNSCSSCSYGYGEYIVDLETYLESTVQYQQEVQENMCQACEECGNWDDQQQADENNQDAEGDDGGRRKLQDYAYDVDCDSCYDECMKIENMEENGYVDATNFLECQMIYDPEDDGKAGLYAGPMCASQGAKIKIGVFTDEYCSELDSTKDVDDYLIDDDGYQMKLSHALLKTVYASDSCVSCLMPEEQDDNNNGDDNNNNQDEDEEPEVLEMCGELYEAAAKCEKVNGFDDGYAGYYGYENQLANEEVVCDFIDSIKAGSYDEQGEIVVNGGNGSMGGGAKTTGGQKFALTFFILGTVGLAAYAGMLHSKLTKGNADLSSQGGAMA